LVHKYDIINGEVEEGSSNIRFGRKIFVVLSSDNVSEGRCFADNVTKKN